jgi:hypothetical protein
MTVSYDVKFYGRPGHLMTPKQRQIEANKDEAICYVEHHFNSNVGKPGSYAAVLLAHNHSNKSELWATDYLSRLYAAAGTVLSATKVVHLAAGERGEALIVRTKMPAVILEPLFCNNLNHIHWIAGLGWLNLAQVLTESIKAQFPGGGLVAFSIGHRYRPKKDEGAPAVGIPPRTEAFWVESVMLKAAMILTGKNYSADTLTC